MRPDPYLVAKRLAADLPVAQEAAVRDALAVAGADIHGALAVLTAALGAIVVERVDAEARPAVLGACAIASLHAAARRIAAGQG